MNMCSYTLLAVSFRYQTR